MSSSKNLEFEKTSFLSKSNSAFIEQMYLKFINKDAIFLKVGRIILKEWVKIQA